MKAVFNDLLSFATSHLGIAATALGSIVSTLAAYFREQLRAAIKWVLGPITRRLPWNQNDAHKGPPLAPEHGSDLISQLSVVDVFLTSMDGKSASYQKTSNYIVNKDELNAYHEGVTSAANASGFSTRWGKIVATTKEHGFYISRIDLGDVHLKGSRFTNVFTADLHDCFTTDEEHWTQEIAFPTKHLTLQIHFPKGRPPKLVRCKLVEGVVDRQLKTNARILDMSGEKCIVWELESPNFKDIYKLEWIW